MIKKERKTEVKPRELTPEEQVDALKIQVEDLVKNNESLNAKNTELENAVLELASIIGGAS
jgi:regulator of replication initiation timing